MKNDSSDMFDVLGRITELRKARGISVYRLAKLSGIPQSTIATWYQKGLYPPIDKIEKVCRALDVSLSEFFRTADDMYIGKDEDVLFLEKWHALPENERKTLSDMLSLLSERIKK